METNVIKTGYLDPAKFRVSRAAHVSAATLGLYAQINKWCDERGYPRGLRTHSILVNKLMYYIEKEAQKTNDHFKIGTGWYLYGPCFEEGRVYEADRRPISIVPMSERVSDQVASVCEALVPPFQKSYKDGGMGGVLREFLAFIYREKCDHPEIREYYVAKHELQCQLWALGDTTPRFGPAELADMVSASVTRFDRVLLQGAYAKAVGLDEDKVNLLIEFTPLVEEHARMAAEGAASGAFFDALQAVAEKILKGIAHLNYAHTFDSFNANRTTSVRDSHLVSAGTILGGLEDENQRLLDAYGANLKATG